MPDLDASHVSEYDQTPLRVVPRSSPQREPAPDSPRSSSNDPAPNPPLGTTPPLSPSRTEPALTSVPPPIGPGNATNDATNDRTSHVSVAMSDDGAADIGWSMLQGFGNADDDDGASSDDGDERDEGASVDDTVDGFPAPPTQIPSSSRAPSLVLDTPRPPSTHSDYSEDGDGASFYDNYRYSRLSVSSKMSKSSAHAIVAVPPPIPTEPPPSVRQSLESPTSPVVNESIPPSSPSSPGTPPPPAVRLPTRNVPPPLTLGIKPSHATAPSISTIASPLLHTGFSSPLSSPQMGSNTTASRSPLSPVFDFRGGGAASALRQKIESERSSPLSSPLPSANSQERTFDQPQPQRTVVAHKEEARGAQPQTPTSPTSTLSSSSSEKKKRGGPLPLVVMNPAPPPPPPYTPTSPVTATPLSPTYSPMPMPSPVIITPRRIISPATAEPGPSKPRASLFQPHPNAPKPSVSSQGPLYWRSMPPPPSPRPSNGNGNGLVETLRRAAQMRVVGANGHLQFCTVYASTAQDLLTSVGPVLIFFSTEPLPPPVSPISMRMANTPSPSSPVPVSPMRMANTPSPVPIPVSPASQGGLRPPATPTTTTMTSNNQNQNVIPRTNFIPKTATFRPRSRSFSGFDSPAIPAAQQKEKRFA